MRAVKVLIVDDSATMRALIASTLSGDQEICVVGEASDPLKAREAIKALNPDVVTLDVEMPNMNGIEFLEKLMRLRPTPVIMVSTLTTRAADITIQALEIGAFDCVAKPGYGDENTFADLPAKVKSAALSNRRCLGSIKAPQAARPEAANGYDWDGKLVAIGASTGGVEALIDVIAHFPANCPPTVIAQHMPASFTTSFAQRLDRLCAAHVSEATDGAPLRPGRVYLAPGGEAHLEVAGRSEFVCRLRKGEKISGHRPSVDALFHSVAKSGTAAVGVILTGMGGDGALGLLAMKEAGAVTLGQDEASSIVYGMPKVAFERGAVQSQMPLHKIGAEILRVTNKSKRNSRG